jgi:hypothetical protein
MQPHTNTDFLNEFAASILLIELEFVVLIFCRRSAKLISPGVADVVWRKCLEAPELSQKPFAIYWEKQDGDFILFDDNVVVPGYQRS